YVVPRGLLVLLSRVAGLEPPVDTVYAAFRDEAGLRAELAQAKELGCFGKLAIHPAQIPPINEAFTPSEDEVAWARQVLDAFAASLAAGRGVGRADDAMVEQPIAERARRLLALAEAIGVGPGAGPPHPPDAARLSGAGGSASAAAGAGQQGRGAFGEGQSARRQCRARQRSGPGRTQLGAAGGVGAGGPADRAGRAHHHPRPRRGAVLPGDRGGEPRLL